MRKNISQMVVNNGGVLLMVVNSEKKFINLTNPKTKMLRKKFPFIRLIF